jgi:pentatricopeptide repeat protein
MEADGVVPDAVSYTTAMQRASVEVASAVMQQMRAAGLGVGTLTFNAMLNACAKEGDWQMALGLLEEMDREVGAGGTCHGDAWSVPEWSPAAYA